MTVLTEQFASWLKNGKWEPMPLAAGVIIDWFLSFENGFVIVVAAATFGCTVWPFARARSALTPPLLSATGL
jgi:hypothetical protein